MSHILSACFKVHHCGIRKMSYGSYWNGRGLDSGEWEILMEDNQPHFIVWGSYQLFSYLIPDVCCANEPKWLSKLDMNLLCKLSELNHCQLTVKSTSSQGDFNFLWQYSKLEFLTPKASHYTIMIIIMIDIISVINVITIGKKWKPLVQLFQLWKLRHSWWSQKPPQTNSSNSSENTINKKFNGRA